MSEPARPHEPDDEFDDTTDDGPDVEEIAARADAVAARRRGDPDERGHAQVVGLDLGAMAGRPELEPVVQYLTYIQSRRGEESHLLFVRYDDLDEMAAYEGQDTAAFLERLDQLGVVISPN